ncbi:MAG: YifB family Mg chelatase-like AAA ATPase [Candidatus Dojkabacteria bacterium]
MESNKVSSVIIQGVEGQRVEIEASLHAGLNVFKVVGLPDRAITEAKERITSAILASGLDYPYGALTVNLTPAFMPKAGTSLDLAIALACLQAQAGSDIAVFGELGLDGTTRKSESAASFVIAAKELGFSYAMIPKANHEDCIRIPGIEIISVVSLQEALQLIKQPSVLMANSKLKSKPYSSNPNNPLEPKKKQPELPPAQKLLLLTAREDLLEIMEIAVAGAHNMLFDGPPGGGKSTLMNLLPLLAPELAQKEQLEVYKLHSLVGKIGYNQAKRPPLRSPHHSISQVALIGGGSTPTPGEITLAHNGFLFLDEVGEFDASTLDAMREPMISGEITISRANYKVKFPARFQLLASRNPCPCGWYEDPSGRCTCSLHEISRYQKKLSGAMLDRIDIKQLIERIDEFESSGITVEQAKERFLKSKLRIANARIMQKERFGCLNARYDNPLDRGLIRISAAAEADHSKLHKKGDLSLRSANKILMLARTIADLESSEKIEPSHIEKGYLLNI